MLWSSLFFTISLFSNTYGALNSNSITENNGPYWIGDGYNLSWTPDVLDSDLVDVVLYYGADLASSWTLLTDVNNTGTNRINVTVGENLSNTVEQLLIANGTMGQFKLQIPSFINNSNITMREYDLTPQIAIYQTIMFTTEGRLISSGSRTSIHELSVSVRRDAYVSMGSNVQFVAAFVTLHEESMTWTLDDTLGIATGPTQMPTMFPTSVPTMMPTIMNNTNGNNTNSSNPIAIESLKDNNNNNNDKSGSGATTPSPTTFHTTDGNKKQQGKGQGRRLLEASLSLKDITLGLSEDDKLNNYEANVCISGARLSTWCTFNLNLTIPASTPAGGPLTLAIGLSDGSQDENGTTVISYYTVNNNEYALEQYTQFIVYNESNVAIDLDYQRMNESLFIKYENIDMSVSIGDNITDAEVFVTLRNINKDKFYYLECGRQLPEYFTKFGWRTTSETEMNVTLPPGVYNFGLYWGVTDSFVNTITNRDLYGFTSEDGFPIIRILDETVNDTSFAAVTIKDDKYSYSKGENKIEFEAAFNDGVELTGFIEQCVLPENETILANDTTNCHNYTESEFSFLYKDGEKQSIKFPSNLLKTKLSNNESVTNLYISALLCDGETELTTIIPLEITSSSSKTSGLSAGAIVGIVCAGVLVLGLAAWWLCMKKGGSDQYRELEG